MQRERKGFQHRLCSFPVDLSRGLLQEGEEPEPLPLLSLASYRCRHTRTRNTKQHQLHCLFSIPIFRNENG